MNIKALALVVVLALVGCDQPIDNVGAPRINDRMVPKISCDRQVGSGIQINRNTVITAEHVIRDGGCNVVYDRGVSPRSLTVVNSTSRDDFAELTSSDNLRGTNMRLSCEGVIAGETYWLAGYPGGGNLSVVQVQATDRYIRGVTANSRYTIDNLRVMQGHVYSGMSGGPVINQSGQVVAIISSVSRSASDETMVKELTDTWMC